MSFKIAQCYLELQDWRAALTELETIPEALRGAAVLCRLGKLYLQSGNKSLAKQALQVWSFSLQHSGASQGGWPPSTRELIVRQSMQQCLQEHPVAVEAATALADLGLPYADIVKLSPLMSCARLWPDGDHSSRSEAPPSHAAAPAIPRTPSVRQAGPPQEQAHAQPRRDAETESPNRRSALARHKSHVLPANSPAIRSSGIRAGNGSADGVTAVLDTPTSSAPAASDAVLARVEGDYAVAALSAASLPSSATRPFLPAASAAVPEHGQTARSSKRRRVGGLPGSALDDAAFTTPAQPQNVQTDNVMRGCENAGSDDAAAPGSPVPRKRTWTPLRKEGRSAPQEDSPDSPGPPRAGMAHTGTDSSSRVPPSAQYRACQRLSEEEKRDLRAQRGLGWLGLLVQAHGHMHTAAICEASAAYNALADLFPNELTSVLGAAQALVAAGEYVGACGTFQRARQLDPLNVHGMDVYAALLLDRDCRSDLRQLSRDMTNIDLALPEVWAVMASFWQSKGSWDNAIKFVDRCASAASLLSRARLAAVLPPSPRSLVQWA